MFIGPVPYITRKRICLGREIVTFVPDYSYPGVRERIAAEVDLIEDACYDRRKL